MQSDGVSVETRLIEGPGCSFEHAVFCAASASRRARAVLVPSGAVGRWSEPSPAAEQWVELARALAARGVEAVLFDVPRREDRSVPATEGERAERRDRLRRVLARPDMPDMPDMPCPPTILVGHSLGCETILDVLCERAATSLDVERVVLAAHVIDETRTIMASVIEFVLVYGSRDGVAYVPAGEFDPRAIEVEGPTRYGPRSAEHLIVVPGCRRSVVVLEGRGHDLRRADGEPESGPVLLPSVLGEPVQQLVELQNNQARP